MYTNYGKTGNLSKSSEHYIENAERHYKAKRYKEALRDCDFAIQLDSTCARAYHGRGLIFSQQKRYKEALENYQKSRQIMPENAKLHVDIAELFYIIEDYQQSFLYYQKAIELDTKYSTVYHGKVKNLVNNALSLRSKGRRTAAIEAFEQVLLFHPTNQQANDAISEIHDEIAHISTPMYPSLDKQPPHATVGQSLTRTDQTFTNYNNEMNSLPSTHPFNCRCFKCLEL